VKAGALCCLLQPVFEGTQPLEVFYDEERTDGKVAVPIAEGYEYSVLQEAGQDRQTYRFTERRFVFRSFAQAHKQERSLHARLDKAIGTIEALNDRRQGKKRFKSEGELSTLISAIVSKYRVGDLLDVRYSTTGNEQPIRRYRVQPAGVRIEQSCQVKITVNEAALENAIALLGWRIFATNQPYDQLSMEQAVLAYCAEYRIEHWFSRLKGKPLSLTLMYLSTDTHIKGLIRFLMLAIRALTLMEFQVRKTLAQTGQILRGLYPGQAGRKNERPTAELILRAFSNITLTRIRDGTRSIFHITPSTSLQHNILQPIGFQKTIYETGNYHF
jgi:transposase